MINEYTWLLKILLAHLLTDFVLQPKSWVHHRKLNHFASSRLYLHGLVTAAVPLVLVGLSFWPAILAIGISHVIIDGWKSYQRESIGYFITDQVLHLTIIFACWFSYFMSFEQAVTALNESGNDPQIWIYIIGVIFLTSPAGILIGQLTRGWREKILNPESLANAGKWIGIIERLIVFIFVLLGQYAAISLLVAAKGIIRFNEKDRPEVKTEYLVIGTLMSIGIALIIGVLVRKLSLIG
jgi:hypothetical protein